MATEVYMEQEAERHKSNITYAFYSAYFHLKGQKSLSSKDLRDVLKKIGKQDNEMSDEQLYKQAIAITSRMGG